MAFLWYQSTTDNEDTLYKNNNLTGNEELTI